MLPYHLKLKDLSGKEMALSSFKGKVLLIVNTASECGYTPQYAGLQKLYVAYAPEGFEVLGFPCNDFGKQEPSPENEIQSFVQKKFGVTFPMFQKITTKGSDSHPLYRFLTQESGDSFKGDIKWNFTKFLVGRDGTLIQRFDSGVEPQDPSLIQAVETQLKKK